MKIDIFDVGHGACSVVTCPDGRRLMIDCGSKTSPPYWWPSIQFYGETFAGLILSNLDEDHVRDFESTLRTVRVATVCINNTIDAARLKSIKRDGMAAGVGAVQSYLESPSCLNLLLDLPQIIVSLFRFPFGAFDDTNNLSLITFVEYGQFCILFPGDLEETGWKRALSNLQFRTLLRRVRLFVTSHHGRETGCCAELFEWGLCRPDAFIISDKEMVHDTQETTSWYRGHANGLNKILSYPWEAPETRYVFTTRSDHCISINVPPDGGYILYPNSAVQKNVEPKCAEVPAPTWPSLLLGASLAGGIAKKST
jgi:beta-lactamase superfamily II metal-dependent hydrolase